jgi:hypothetical protein
MYRLKDYNLNAVTCSGLLAVPSWTKTPSKAYKVPETDLLVRSI